MRDRKDQEEQSSTKNINQVMKEKQSQKESQSVLVRFYALYNALPPNSQLAFWKAIFVMLTQPFQVAMRYQQKMLNNKVEPKVLSAKQAVKEILEKNKPSLISPFYRGVWPAVGKEAFKNFFYKAYVLAYVPDAIKSVLSYMTLNKIMSPTPYHVVQSCVAGVVASGIDTALGGALDSWGTHSATSHGEDVHKKYLREVWFAGSPIESIKRAYRGSGASFIKSSIAFTTTFGISQSVSNWTSHAFGVDGEKKKPFYVKLTSAFLVGGVVAILSSPIDIVKTQLQMVNPTKLPVVAALKNNYSMHGIKGITAGLPLKFVMVVMGWAMNDIFFQHMVGADLQKEKAHQLKR